MSVFGKLVCIIVSSMSTIWSISFRLQSCYYGPFLSLLVTKSDFIWTIKKFMLIKLHMDAFSILIGLPVVKERSSFVKCQYVTCYFCYLLNRSVIIFLDISCIRHSLFLPLLESLNVVTAYLHKSSTVEKCRHARIFANWRGL